MNVGIAGAGSIAFASAALLLDGGHRVMLWSPSGNGTRALAGGENLRSEGALQGSYSPLVASSADALATFAEVILIALPGYGHKRVIDALLPSLKHGHTVIISSHTSFGALYLAQQLAERNLSLPIVAWGTTVATGRRQSDTRVLVNTIRSRIDMCSVPAETVESCLALCQQLFGDRFQVRDGLLAITLSNLNPQNHLGIALGNITRMERGEHWSQGENVTPAVGRLLEALDGERLAIANALGLSVKTIFEHFHQSFQVPVASIAEMNQRMHQLGKGGTGPATADSRYVTEDVPYGLVTTAKLGRLVGRPARLHEAGIDILSAMYGRDFFAENELIDALRFDQLSLRQLQEAAHSGLLPNSPGANDPQTFNQGEPI